MSDRRPVDPGAPQLAPAASSAITASGRRPTAHRIQLERAERRLSVASDAVTTRRRAAFVLVAIDMLVIWLVVFLSPLVDWELPKVAAVGWALLAATILGTFLAGGYRVERSGMAARFGPFGAMLGLAVAWLVMKFLSTKLAMRPMRPPAAEGIALAAVLFGTWVAATRIALQWALRTIEARAKLLFVGSSAMADQIAERLTTTGNTTPLYRFDPALTSKQAAPDSRVFPLAELDAHASGAVRAIVLSTPLDELPQQTIADLVHCRVLNVPVLSPSDFIEGVWQRTPIDLDDTSWFLQDGRLHGTRAPLFVSAKRVADVLGAVMGLALAAPLLVVAGVAIKLSSRGPVFFGQTRVGRMKQPFTIVKLRTMHVSAEEDGAQWATADDTRVTTVGRFLRRTRIDELPQLLNVLLGHMSLVGPRPERPEFTRELEQIVPYYDFRHLVRPGITGWAQVSHPYGGSVKDAVTKLEFDIYYVKHASVLFDLRILAHTVRVVLTMRGY